MSCVRASIGYRAATKVTTFECSRGDKEWFYADKSRWTDHQIRATRAVWIYVTCAKCATRIAYDEAGAVAEVTGDSEAKAGDGVSETGQG